MNEYKLKYGYMICFATTLHFLQQLQTFWICEKLHNFYQVTVRQDDMLVGAQAHAYTFMLVECSLNRICLHIWEWSVLKVWTILNPVDF